MRGRGTFLAAMLALIGGPAAADPSGDAQPASRSVASSYAAIVADAAQQFGIPAAWIWAVIRVESGRDPHAVSSAGAMGLMQVMPTTWDAMRARYSLGADPFDAHDNIVAGTAFLRAMLDRYGSRMAMLAAYNAGPARYDDWLAGRRPLPQETVVYLTRFGSATGDDRVTARPDPLAWTRAPLFTRPGFAVDAAPAQPSGDASAASTTAMAAVQDAPPDALFVARPKGESAR